MFSIQFLNAMNDLVVKNTILVLITYHGLTIANWSREVSVNVVALAFLIPFILLSTYAGKLADSYNKVNLIKIIKFAELAIVVIMALGIYYSSMLLMLLAITLMGVHSTFFGPIKYSILSDYIVERKKLLLANGFIEMGTFVAVLLGQFLGSWFMGHGERGLVMLIFALSTIVGLSLSFVLENLQPLGLRPAFKWNVFRDIWNSYQKTISYAKLKICIHSISWFWAMGVVYTTQLPVFTLKFMGGSAHVFSVLLAIFSVAIGAGSISCAKLSCGKIRHSLVIYGAIGVIISSLLLLLVNCGIADKQQSLSQFSHSLSGIINYIVIFACGFSAGFFSVTCYSELQISAPPQILSEVMAVNNLVNSIYMVIAAICCSVLLIFISVWWLLMITILCHALFILVYYRSCILRFSE